MKVLKIIFYIILGLAVAGLIAFLILDEPLPEGSRTTRADSLAMKMMRSVNYKAWDTTRYVSWDFPGGHHLLWDKINDYAEVSWGNKRVLVDLVNVSGKVFEGGQMIEDPDKEVVKKAWDIFNNDSFWLNAVVKAFDPGTVRSLVEKDGREGLKITYSQGGSTPGDSYVWYLDENGRPESFELWVSVFPIGGLEMTWEDWIELSTGALVATSHESNIGLTLNLSNIEAAQELSQLSRDPDLFSPLSQP